jgi:hypothetical protein
MTTDPDRRYRPLLDRRIPRDQVELGRAYVIHARNGGVGVAVEVNGQLAYRLHRVKFDRHNLFAESDWDQGPPFGTAIPLRLLDDLPPVEDGELLDWLAAREEECRDEVQEAWKVVLGRLA